MEQLNFITAFTAGLLSFLSPCVLPVIPGYISLITGISTKQLIAETNSLRSTVIINSVLFVSGFTLIFILLQIVLKGIQFLIDPRFLNYLFGSIIILFGLHTAGLLRFKFLYYQKKINIQKRSWGLFSSFIIGIAFGFAWTPCIGPILAGILALASVQATFWKGTSLLVTYSLGLGIPFILTGFFLDYFLKILSRLNRYLRWVELISGILLVIIGIFILTGNFYKLAGI